MGVLWGFAVIRVLSDSESLRSYLFNKLISNFMLQEAGNCTLITWRAKLKCGPITTGEITDIRLLDELYVNNKFSA